jgi:hypothetical protein
MRLPAFQHALAAATGGGLGVCPRSSQSWGPVPPVASHLSKVLGQYAPSTVLYDGFPEGTVKFLNAAEMHKMWVGWGTKLRPSVAVAVYKLSGHFLWLALTSGVLSFSPPFHLRRTLVEGFLLHSFASFLPPLVVGHCFN